MTHLTFYPELCQFIFYGSTFSTDEWNSPAVTSRIKITYFIGFDVTINIEHTNDGGATWHNDFLICQLADPLTADCCGATSTNLKNWQGTTFGAVTIVVENNTCCKTGVDGDCVEGDGACEDGICLESP